MTDNTQKLINEAINASIKFEELMDSIDFNSYLPEDNGKLTDRKYDEYKNMVADALKLCEDIIDEIPNKKEELPAGCSDTKIFVFHLIYNLFKVKKIRLEARQKSNWDEEKRMYALAINKLHEVLYGILGKEDKIKNKSELLMKILYYNEMSIWHSGLTESSMSLGYAEAALFILKEILDGDEYVGLRTFALCNKGEAERNLHDYEKALKTFHKIVDKYKRNSKNSDYNQALMRIALILNDQGRSVEAIDILDKMDLSKKDFRLLERDLEKASAYIDQKEYEKAKKEIDKYKARDQWGNTFTFRKAALSEVRCLLEWRKNKPTEFKKEQKKEWKEEYENISSKIKGIDETKIEGIIKECIDRKDGSNFKKACRYFSEFHEFEKRKIENKLSKEDKKKASEQELWGYFVYLFYEKMDKVFQNIQNVQDWKDIKKKLQEKRSRYFIFIINKIENTEYMKDFFYSYMDYCRSNQSSNKNEIIERLYKRLIDLWQEKDELQELEKIERDYIAFKELVEKKPNTDGNLRAAAKLIDTKYFQIKPPKNKKDRVYLSLNTIENRIHRNTDEFADKILGSSKQILPSSEKSINGILTVLRRWNSFTPALSSPGSLSRGGGYFLYLKDKNNKSKGIVIDPGYDFLDNLFAEGFSINDIDIVLISHAHPDHTDNFPKMLSLFHEMNGRLKQWKEKAKEYDRKHIKIILSQGVFDFFKKQMDYSKESLKDIYVVDTKRDEPFYTDPIGNGKELQIKAFRTAHGDLSQWESIGFIFSIEEIEIGFTSDAHWTGKFWKKFSGCSIICAHLGAIVNILSAKNFCYTFCKDSPKVEDVKCKEYDECEKSNFSKVKISINKMKDQVRDENHLYLGGLISFFNPLLKKDKLKLGIISEFGEELKGGIRMDLYHKFDDWFQGEKDEDESMHRRCLPGDIGLRVDIFSGDVFCQTCQRYVDRKTINPIAYGKEEAIFFVCDECKSVLSTYQIEEKLKDYYENGRRLKLADESK